MKPMKPRRDSITNATNGQMAPMWWNHRQPVVSFVQFVTGYRLDRLNRLTGFSILDALASRHACVIRMLDGQHLGHQIGELDDFRMRTAAGKHQFHVLWLGIHER